MTASETPDELRARLKQAYDNSWWDPIIEAWPAIDGMLARLTAAEAAVAESLARSGCNLSAEAVALCVEQNESCSCAPLLALRERSS